MSSVNPTCEPPQHPPSFARSCLLGLCVTLGIILTVVVIGGTVVRARRLPLLDQSRFDAAWQKWQGAGPQNYRISIKVDGRQPATYQVTVRDGQVETATRNGNHLTQRRTMGTWSVPGMFDTIEYDVRAISRSDVASNSGSQTLVVRAEFDRQLGIPSKYFRSDYRTKTTTTWKVIEFVDLDSTATGAPDK